MYKELKEYLQDKTLSPAKPSWVIDTVRARWVDSNGTSHAYAIPPSKIMSVEVSRHGSADGTVSFGCVETAEVSITILRDEYERFRPAVLNQPNDVTMAVELRAYYVDADGLQHTVNYGTGLGAYVIDESATITSDFTVEMRLVSKISAPWCDEKLPSGVYVDKYKTLRENTDVLFAGTTLATENEYLPYDQDLAYGIVFDDDALSESNPHVYASAFPVGGVTYRDLLSALAIEALGCVKFRPRFDASYDDNGGTYHQVYYNRREPAVVSAIDAYSVNGRNPSVITIDALSMASAYSITQGYAGWNTISVARKQGGNPIVAHAQTSGTSDDYRLWASGTVQVDGAKLFDNDAVILEWLFGTSEPGQHFLAPMRAVQGFTLDLLEPIMWLEPFDVITVVDMRGEEHLCCITEIVERFGSGGARMSLSCVVNQDDVDSTIGGSSTVGSVSLTSRVDAIESWRANTPTLGALAGKDSLVAADIPNISADKITSGTLDAARIPNLAASKITSGTLGTARIPTLSVSKIDGLSPTSFTLTADTTHTVSISNQSNRAFTGINLVKCAFQFNVTMKSAVTAGIPFKVGTVPADYKPNVITALNIAYAPTGTAGKYAWSAFIDNDGVVWARRSEAFSSGNSLTNMRIAGVWTI